MSRMSHHIICMCGNNLGGWPLGTMSLVTVCFKQTEQKLGETVEDYDAKKCITRVKKRTAQ